MFDHHEVIVSDDFVLPSVIFSALPCRVTRRVLPESVRMNVEYLNLGFISLIISSVVSHFFSNHIIIRAMNNNLMKH